jgi:hypothetical protein
MIVIADSSGSMQELGKTMLVRNLINHIRMVGRLRNRPDWLEELVVLRWSDKIEVIRLSSDDDLPNWDVEGRLQIAPLIEALNGLVGGSKWSRILLLSDGHWATSDVQAFKKWNRTRSMVSVRALSIGPDSARSVLTKVSDGGSFQAEDIVPAIASWPLLSDVQLPHAVGELSVAEGDLR